MIWFILILVFILGLVIGSFINALEYRIEEKKDIGGRSFCPKCKHSLSWKDLIPIFSFLVLRGKCRYCKKDISWQYPIVELLTGITFVAVAINTNFVRIINNIIVQESIGNSELITFIIGLLCLFFIIFSLILVALHDQKTTYVLSGYIYVAMLATIIYLTISYTGLWNIKDIYSYLLPYFYSSLAAMSPFVFLYLISKGKWMGAGDIEVAAMLGLLLGWPTFLVGLYFAFISGSIWGLLKVYLLKNAGMKSEIPFAPFLIVGTIFAFVFGEQLISLYVKIFLG